MIIKYKTPEAETRHAEYSIIGNNLLIGSIILMLDRYEKDDDVHMDICRDKMGNLTTGVIPGWSTAYVAQVDIPGRTYHEIEGEGISENGEPVMIQEADPYDPEKTTLTLWGTED